MWSSDSKSLKESSCCVSWRPADRPVGEEEEEEWSTHPFAVLPSVGQHLLQGPDRQGLLQHKVADAQVWRNILEDGGRERRGHTHKKSLIIVWAKVQQCEQVGDQQTRRRVYWCDGLRGKGSMLTLRTHGYGCNGYRRPYSNAVSQICGDPINIWGHSREFSLKTYRDET